MLYKIDWLSFTVKRAVGEEENEPSAWLSVRQALLDLLGDHVGVLSSGLDWSWGKGRTPYNISQQRQDNGAMIFFHPRLDHALVEITGRGCELLSEDPRAWDFMQAIQPRLTRIDIAADILCDENPITFSEQRDHGRFRSHSEFVSESGTTAYVGSRTSNRYARVYRYNPPHDRAHLLRIETVLKAEDAKITAQHVLDHGIASATKGLGEAFGWSSPLWDVESEDDATLSAWRPERRKGKTLFWLNDTIAPLLVRLHEAGELDAGAWFADHVLKKIPPPIVG